MEVYVLDSLLRRSEVIDRFESLIWTERWASWGDFELAIRSTYGSRGLLRKGTQLAMNQSDRVMTVETIEDGTDSDGKSILKVKGRSIESIFEDRGAKASHSDLTTEPTWDITNTPAAIMRKIVHDICVTGVLSVYDKIPFIVEARQPSLPADTILEPPDPIMVKLEPQTVYKAITNVANTWELGFRLLRNGDAAQLYFDVYAGSDRTSSQTTRPPVIFAPELDNLTDTTELISIEGAKNVAYVYSKNGFQEVIPAAVPIDTDGFERRILIVNANDIELEAGSELDSALIQRGKEALAEHREIQALDGEIRQNSQYKYNVDYYLGDLVEMRNVDGIANQMRVTEQIFVSDKEGERTYPTLAINQFVSMGSWLSFAPGLSWIDYDADTTTVWATLP